MRMRELVQRLQGLSDIEDKLRQACLGGVQRLNADDFESEGIDELMVRIMRPHVPTTITLGGWRKERKTEIINGFQRETYELRALLEGGDLAWFEVRTVPVRSVESHFEEKSNELVLRVAPKQGLDVGATLQKMANDVTFNVDAYRGLAEKLATQIESEIRKELERLHASFKRGKELFDAIPFPIARWPEPGLALLETSEKPLLSVLSIPKRIVQAPQAGSAGPAKLQYIEESAYFEILDSCMSMANTITRNPGTFARFWSSAKDPGVEETPFRDVLLLGLNGTFKGQATNETFNGIGKTDILVRVEDRTLFVAECKVWKGEQSYTDAISQLLDRYVTWDVLRVAVIMFSGNKSFTRMLSRFRAATESHPYCKAITSSLNSGQQIRWAAKHPSDDARQDLTVTSIAIHVPGVNEED